MCIDTTCIQFRHFNARMHVYAFADCFNLYAYASVKKVDKCAEFELSSKTVNKKPYISRTVQLLKIFAFSVERKT